MLNREAYEQIFIHETRADEYERLGNHTEAKWQREQAKSIRLFYEHSVTQLGHGLTTP
jgi:hypothetical protein